MNINLELAGRIQLLYANNDYPNINQIIEVLDNYHITPVDLIGQYSFEQKVDYFLGAKRTEGLSAKTLDNYRLYLKIFVGQMPKRAEDIVTNDIRKFIIYLSDTRSLKNSSIQSVINILRSFFGWLTVEEIIPKNPMLRIKSYTIDRKRTREPLTSEELERVRDACKDYREKALFEFLYSSGCRLSEATQIDLSTIDFNRRSVKVIGKGDKVRTLLFSVKAKYMIEEYLKLRPAGTALFCSSRQPYGRLKGRSVQRIIESIGVRASLSRHIHPHILRHTFATNCLNSGMDITVIQQLLGHNDLSTTQIYAEMNQENVRREYDKFVA